MGQHGNPSWLGIVVVVVVVHSLVLCNNCCFVRCFVLKPPNNGAAAKLSSFQQPQIQQQQQSPQPLTIVHSNYFDDFAGFNLGDDDDEDEDDEEEEDDDDDEDIDDIDDAAVADFRSRMGNLFGPSDVFDDDEDEDDDYDDDDDDDDDLEDMDDREGLPSTGGESVDDLIRRATQSSSSSSSGAASSLAKPTDWAKESNTIEPGVLLVANPSKFCTDFGPKVSSPSASLLSKFGLTIPPPADLGPDRRADLLPVLCVIGKHPIRGAQAVLLNRRTGYLLGDLEQQQQQQQQDVPPGQQESEKDSPPPPRLGAFMIQPLWFGGTSAGGSDDGGGVSNESGLDMLHQCADVPGAKQLTQDGLYWGGDPELAQDALNNPALDRIYTGFDFKFFVQGTRWLPLQLEKEVRDGTWFVANVSKEVLFKPRDRMGTRRAKPLWTEIMELMGGEYKDIRDQLYADDAPFP